MKQSTVGSCLALMIALLIPQSSHAIANSSTGCVNEDTVVITVVALNDAATTVDPYFFRDNTIPRAFYWEEDKYNSRKFTFADAIEPLTIGTIQENGAYLLQLVFDRAALAAGGYLKNAGDSLCNDGIIYLKYCLPTAVDCIPGIQNDHTIDVNVCLDLCTSPEPTPEPTPDPTPEPTPEPTPVLYIDIKPTSCPNPLQMNGGGTLPVAILGTELLDVSYVDVSSIAILGVAPERYAYEDVTAPYSGTFTGACMDCTTAGPDGYTDLTLKFDKQAIVDALQAQAASQGISLNNGDCVTLTLTADVLVGEELQPFAGQDVMRIQSNVVNLGKPKKK